MLEDIAPLRACKYPVIAINEASIVYLDPIAYCVTLHGEFIPYWQHIRSARHASVTEARWISWWRDDAAMQRAVALIQDPHAAARVERSTVVNHGGSSALWATELAMTELGFDRVILCGCPLDGMDKLCASGEGTLRGEPHPEGYNVYRTPWERMAPELIGRVSSMSGWTRTVFGPPQEVGA